MELEDAGNRFWKLRPTKLFLRELPARIDRKDKRQVPQSFKNIFYEDTGNVCLGKSFLSEPHAKR